MTHRDCDHPATKAGRAACRRAGEKARTNPYDPTEIRVIKVGDLYSVVKGTEVLEACVTRKAANEYAASARAIDLHLGCYGE